MLEFEINQEMIKKIKQLEQGVSGQSSIIEKMKAELANIVSYNQKNIKNKRDALKNILSNYQELPEQINQKKNIYQKLKQDNQQLRMSFSQNNCIINTLIHQIQQGKKDKNFLNQNINKINKKSKNVENEINDLKKQIQRICKQLGFESYSGFNKQNINSKKQKSYKIIQNHRKIQNKVNTIKRKIDKNSHNLQELGKIENKLLQQINLKNKELQEIRQQNEGKYIGKQCLQQLQKNVQIDSKLLDNYIKQNNYLRDNLEKITGEKYKSMNLQIHQTSIVYKEKQWKDLQNLQNQKQQIIKNQKAHLLQIVNKLDQLGSEFRKQQQKKQQLRQAYEQINMQLQNLKKLI